jgi:hypothetical protein
MNTEIIQKIFENLDLNSRIELGLPPRRLPHEVISNLQSKFPRPELVYIQDTKTLLNFHLKFVGLIISKPVDLDFSEDDLTIFNRFSKEYICEVICDCGNFTTIVRSDPWITELKVKIIETEYEAENTLCSS